MHLLYLAKAHSLDESMISNQTFNTYKTVLLDFNNLSNEEANQLRISSLYRDMVRYAQYRFSKVFIRVDARRMAVKIAAE
ncbi:putative toxin [Escherichia coli]|nr:putative toxin [Escherichia coli]